MMTLLGITVWESFQKWFSIPAVWISVLLFIAGSSLVLLARRIARVVKKTNSIADNDKTLITIKSIGIVMMFVGLMIIVFI